VGLLPFLYGSDKKAPDHDVKEAAKKFFFFCGMGTKALSPPPKLSGK